MGPLSLAAALALPVSAPPTRTPEWKLPAVTAEKRLEEDAGRVEREIERLRDKYGPRTMPAYYQTDPVWASDPYAHGSTIGAAGCGLTTAAMSIEWWTRQQCTPRHLAQQVGDSCTIGNLNYMPAFADYVRGLGLSASEKYWDISRAIADARSGKTVWCAGGGRLGARSYGGHLVLLWCDADGALHINDPACAENTRIWSEDEILAAGSYWTYSISVWKEF